MHVARRDREHCSRRYDHVRPFVLPANINLSHGELLVTQPVTLQGPGTGLLTVSAGGNSRVLNINLLGYIDPTVVISGMLLTDGAVHGADGSNGVAAGQNGVDGGTAAGGCIFIYAAELTLEQVSITHCLAPGGNRGAGAKG